MADFSLHSIVLQDGDTTTFSPHVAKTNLDLGIVKLSPETVHYTFHGIRTDLATETGNSKVTSPTIKLASGEYITDSWVIAEYLDKTHGGLIFGSEAGKEFARFLNYWVDNSLAVDLRPLIAPFVAKKISKQSYEHKFAPIKDTIDTWTAQLSDKEITDKHYTATRAQLAVVEKTLQSKKDAGLKQLFLAGEKPTHADAVVFGWYAFSRVNPDIEANVWRHASLPLVGEWLDALFASGVVKKDNLL
ncbi:hypothetical protein P7C73_g2852, partial [Tremellales sp. Uapishka_1]